MQENTSQYQEGEFVPSGHFYSVVPSAATRQKHVGAIKPAVDSIPGININRSGQIQLLHTFEPYFDSCTFPHEQTSGHRYFYLNPAYSYGDALTLHAMMRHFSPRRIIEIGSGYSSAAMLDTSEQFLTGAVDFTFIEPYPDLLLSLLSDKDPGSSNIISSGVQSVDLTTFDRLAENDILFIDSTHVSKLDSDVNRIFFDIFPRLNPGVIIHIHDIFWPFEYPDSWIEQGRAWNELYLLRALLQFNDHFEILFFADYLKVTYADWFSEKARLFMRNSGGNFWMRKRVKASLNHPAS